MVGTGGGKNFVVDSFGWIEYFLGGPKASAYAKFTENAKPENCFTPTAVLYEVYRKIRVQAGESAANKFTAQIINVTTILPLTTEIALTAAKISISSSLPFVDSVVKATADSVDAVVVTGDPHFKKIDGVEFI